ncbi:MAG TPA: cyclase family protein [Noviherbaspirillum sp.]|jgi:kynurenine formamidase|uniref:cyclase family protein n=1 Tax=Noviherbaspirillum sp. TaxID=1926288 RepID=UPI002DDCECFC|nr:cyclase family protein [Noviherbaspirillum sp.]HEV2611232.1 cyclase family protein [Noviherbaspirillum sp.]
MRWKNRPPGSNWGDYGPDDQLGRVNMLNREQVLKGAAEVREGRSFCLSLPLNLPGGNLLNPRRNPPRLQPTYRDGKPMLNFPMTRVDADAVDIISDDQVLISLQYSTQWDSLAHVGARFDADGDGNAEMVYYNGYRANADVKGPLDYRDDGAEVECGCSGPHLSQADALGIENMAAHGMQGRGVLVDLHRHFGDARQLVGYDELSMVMAKDGVQVEPGDFLVLRTGFAERVVAMGGDPDPDVLHHSCSVMNGRDERLLQWITDSGISAICADNYAVEAYPAVTVTGKKSLLPLHHHCLFKLGVPLGELWYLHDLAEWLHANKRNRFMLTAPPLRLPGAVGSPVTPIATV